MQGLGLAEDPAVPSAQRSCALAEGRLQRLLDARQLARLRGHSIQDNVRPTRLLRGGGLQRIQIGQLFCAHDAPVALAEQVITQAQILLSITDELGQSDEDMLATKALEDDAGGASYVDVLGWHLVVGAVGD